MEATCRCTGIRTCLICEEKKGSIARKPVHEPLLATVYLCHNCGRVFQSVAASHSPPLQLCSPLCTSDKPVLKTSQCTISAYGIPNFREVIVVKDFVSEEEEQSIVAEIDQSRWAESQSGRRKQVSELWTVL